MQIRFLLLIPLLAMAGCDIPGLGPDPRVAQREAEARAIGGACRHAMRGIEDCYLLNTKASKSAVFAGWKDMDQYMRENKIEGTRSVLTRPADDIATEIQPEARSEAKPASSAKTGNTDKS